MERPAVHITAPVFLATPGQREPQAAREGDIEWERGREGEAEGAKEERMNKKSNPTGFCLVDQNRFQSVLIFLDYIVIPVVMLEWQKL